MTSTCTVCDDETDDLPITETTHDLLEDVASDQGLTDLVFEHIQAAMSDGAEGVDGASALGLPVPVSLFPCDTIIAAYDVISRRVAQDFLLPDCRSGKLDFFFPASDDDISTAVVWPVPRLLTDVIERCSLMVKGDNPRLPRDALLSVDAGLLTLRMTAADAASVSLHQPVLTPIPD